LLFPFSGNLVCKAHLTAASLSPCCNVCQRQDLLLFKQMVTACCLPRAVLRHCCRLQDVSVDLAIAYVAVGIFAATVTHFTIGTQLLKAPGSKTAGQQAGGAAGPAAAAGKAQEELSLMIELPLASSNGLQLQKAFAGTDGYLLGSRAAADGEGECCSGSSSSCAGMGSSRDCIACAARLPSGEQQQQQRENAVGARHTVLAVGAPSDAAIVLGALQHHHSGLGHAQIEQQQQQQRGAAEACVLSEAQLQLAAGSQHIGQQPQAQQQQQRRRPDWPSGERELLLNPGISSSDSSCWVQLDLREKQQLPLQDPQHQPHSSSWWRHSGFRRSSSSSKLGRLHAAGAAAGGFVWSLTSPPLVGCMLAVGVGMLPLLRNQLFSPAGHLLLVQVRLLNNGCCYETARIDTVDDCRCQSMCLFVL
jgi:hypothetical protein